MLLREQKYEGGYSRRQNWEPLSIRRQRWAKKVYQARERHRDRTERMYRQKEEVSTEIVPGETYTPGQLDEIASAILREDSKTELCRVCGLAGEPTGDSQTVPEGISDEEGNELALKFEEMECASGHTWFPGEGQLKGIGGENPILFDEHFQSRKRREIYTTQGTPDPSIVSGMYNRVHPQGRKVNSEEQRKRNGASFYR